MSQRALTAIAANAEAWFQAGEDVCQFVNTLPYGISVQEARERLRTETDLEAVHGSLECLMILTNALRAREMEGDQP